MHTAITSIFKLVLHIIKIADLFGKVLITQLIHFLGQALTAKSVSRLVSRKPNKEPVDGPYSFVLEGRHSIFFHIWDLYTNSQLDSLFIILIGIQRLYIYSTSIDYFLI